MGLTQDDFKIPQDTLDELNAEIESAVSEFFLRNPNEDPLDGISVTFNFTFGYGRDLDVCIAGKTISFELD